MRSEGGNKEKREKEQCPISSPLTQKCSPLSPLSSPFFHLIPLFSVSPSHPVASPPQVYCMPGDFSHEQGPLSSFFSVPVIIIFSLLLRRFSRPPFSPRTWGHSHAVLGCWNSCGGGEACSQKKASSSSPSKIPHIIKVQHLPKICSRLLYWVRRELFFIVKQQRGKNFRGTRRRLDPLCICSIPRRRSRNARHLFSGSLLLLCRFQKQEGEGDREREEEDMGSDPFRRHLLLRPRLVGPLPPPVFCRVTGAISTVFPPFPAKKGGKEERKVKKIPRYFFGCFTSFVVWEFRARQQTKGQEKDAHSSFPFCSFSNSWEFVH